MSNQINANDKTSATTATVGRMASSTFTTQFPPPTKLKMMLAYDVQVVLGVIPFSRVRL